MSLKISKAGMLDSIQDSGRLGYQQFGINPGGTMDKYAAAIANILVDNNKDEAVIEMHFPAPAIFFEQPAMIALSGADFGANINGTSIPLNHAVIINKNTILQFLTPKNKSRCYLAVKGGVKISKWLNSYSTNLIAESGGFSGRKLLKDDILELNSNTNTYKLQDADDFKILPWGANEDFGIPFKEEFLVMSGSELDW